MRKTIRFSIFVLLVLCAGSLTASATSTVNFEASQLAIEEVSDGSLLIFRIQRSGDLSESATIGISTVDGTATGGGWDYGTFEDQESFTFAPGDSVVQGVLAVRNDWFYEGSESFAILLTDPGPNVRLGTRRKLTVIINDTEDYPKVRLEVPAVGSIMMRVEPVVGRQVPTTVNVALSNPSVEPISVTLNTSDGTATAGADYLPATRVVTFEPMRSAPQQVTFTVLGDGIDEQRETFNINLVDLVNVQAVRASNTFTIINNTPYPQQVDTNGDGFADFGGYDPGTSTWFTSQRGETQIRFGMNTDVIVPGDYTGDGQTDVAVWRPSSGDWHVLRSEDGSYFVAHFGASGDLPAPADFDADGIGDFAVFRPSVGNWYIRRSSDGAVEIVRFGSEGDRPVPADFDGDRKADIAIYRPGSGGGSQWWINRSMDGGVTVTNFGIESDRAVAVDYTGDGKADIAVWRRSTGEWFITRSEDATFYVFRGPLYQEMIPAPGDYGGDGRADFALLHTGFHTWNVYHSFDPRYSTFSNADPTLAVPLASVNVH